MGSFSTIGATKLLFEYTIDELARKFNQAEPAVAASFINQGDYIGLVISLIASIFDNTNLSLTKAVSIFDNANLSLSRAGNIIGNANLSNARALDIHDNSARTFPDEWATIFDSYMDAGKAAYIVENSTKRTVDDWACLFDNANLSEAKLQSILDDTNLSIQKGQEIVDAMSNPSKIGTGGRRGYLGDDWQDNKITDRDDAATTPTDLGRIVQIFRPEWSGGLAEDGVFKLTGTDEKQYCSSNFTTGYWYVKWYVAGTSGSRGMKFYFMWVDDNNHYFLEYHTDSPDLSLKKTAGGSISTLISETSIEPYDNCWHDAKVKRDDDGNFEAWYGHISLGTCVDTSITSSNRLYLGCIGDVDTYFDNLQVY